jgi:hypothetical protein
MEMAVEGLKKEVEQRRGDRAYWKPLRQELEFEHIGSPPSNSLKHYF